MPSMFTADLSGACWRKSSYSGAGNDDNCVEVAFAGPAVAIRDSKNPADGRLILPLEQWRALLELARG